MCNLLCEYRNNNKDNNLRHSIPKCLILFINDDKSINMIDGFCKKEIFYLFLKYESLMSKESINLIINHLKSLKLSHSEYIEMEKTINDEEIISKLQSINIFHYFSLIVRSITYFSYSQKEYTFHVNENVSIKPKYDGDECKFRISPNLSNGLFIDKESGEIYGKTNKITLNYEIYTIECSNSFNSLQTFIKLKFEDFYFVRNTTVLNESLKYNENNHIIQHINDEGMLYPCYINCKIDKNKVYHLLYKFNCGSNERMNVCFGVTKKNDYISSNIYKLKESSSLIIRKDHSTLFGGNGSRSDDPKLENYDGKKIELIINTKKKVIKVKVDDDKEFLLFENIECPLYPFVILSCKNNSLELLSVFEE